MFHLVGLDRHGEVVVRKKLFRLQLLRFTAKLQVERIGMEACGGRIFRGGPYIRGNYKINDLEGRISLLPLKDLDMRRGRSITHIGNNPAHVAVEEGGAEENDGTFAAGPDPQLPEAFPSARLVFTVVLSIALGIAANSTSFP